jgi:hypothetical protein
MTHLISEIANLQQCGATAPASLVRQAAADYLVECYGDHAQLGLDIVADSVDWDQAVADINEALDSAGADEYAIDEDDLLAGLALDRDVILAVIAAAIDAEEDPADVLETMGVALAAQQPDGADPREILALASGWTVAIGDETATGPARYEYLLTAA